MKQVLSKLLRAGIVLGVLIAVIQILKPRMGQMMERKFAEMPDDFPPKWMYNNISAIREQNERILELLEGKVEPEKTESVSKSA